MKRTQQHHKKNKFIRNILSLSLCGISSMSYALQALDEHDLRSVNAQDGLYLETSYDQVNLTNLYWEDKAGSASGEKALRAYANNVKISGNDLGTKYQIQTGSNTAGNLGIDLKLESHHSLIEVDGFRVCDTAATATCSPNIGSLGIQSTSPISLHFISQDGLFSNRSDLLSYLELGIKNTHIYLGQDVFNDATKQNQLVLKNLNFNFTGRGLMYIDPIKGLYLETGSNGYVDFNRVFNTGAVPSNLGTFHGVDASDGVDKPSSSGLNLEFMLKKAVEKTALYNMDSYNSPENAVGLIRVGASGRIVNAYLQLRGIDATGSSNNILGSVAGTPIMGSTGIGFRMKGEFTRQGDSSLTGNAKPTTLEIGGAGTNTYGFEFGELTNLAGNGNGYFDSGNIYINLTDAKTLTMPTNYTFQTSRFGNGNMLTTAADYNQNIHFGTTNPYAAVMALRGGEFQAFARQGRFTNSAGVATADLIREAPTTGANTNKWGLALPFYNLNANVAMYGVQTPAANIAYYTADGIRHQVGATGNAQRLGLSLAMSTEGIDRNASNQAVGKKTTSILVLDGEKGYYMGLRNVDMLLKGTGTIGLENGSFNASLPDLLIVMAAEVAAGNLPTSIDASCAVNCSTFARNNDVLFGLKLRLGGQMDFSLIPNSAIKPDGTGNRLSIVGEFDMKDLNGNHITGNTIQISDPVNGSILGLDNITGKLAFNNAIVIDKDRRAGSSTQNEGVVSFNAGFTFNPQAKQSCSGTANAQKCIDGVFRVRDVNFYPPSSVGVNGQRLGELAITGGTLNSSLSIIPRNGSFAF